MVSHTRHIWAGKILNWAAYKHIDIIFELRRGEDIMMTSLNGNIFRITGHLCGEFIGPRWIPHTKASDVELDVFFDLRPNNGWVKTLVRLVIWYAITPIMTSL